MAKSPDVSQDTPNNGDNLLDGFLNSFNMFVENIVSECKKVSPQGEQLVLIESAGDSLVGQTQKVTKFVRESGSRLSEVQRRELDKFLQVQDGVAIATRSVSSAQRVMRSGVLGRLLNWLSQNLGELKKIISEILHFIFDLLHIPFPDWFDRLLQILDQFLNLLLSLLGEVFGIDFGRTARQLSEQEVDFLREWAAFESVRAVRSSGRKSKTEEN